MKKVSRLLFVVSTLVGMTLCAGSCTENIDMSNRYTFTEYTVMSYLETGRQADRFTEYVKMLKMVPVSSQSESTVAQLLSARGHYTCFAPDNGAIQGYLDTLYRKGIITEPSWNGFRDSTSLDSIRKVIVYNSIIDGGDATQYETGDFPANDNDEFNIANMNDRKLSVTWGKINPDSIFINGEAAMDMNIRNIEAINGRVHEMNDVIAPSNETLRDYLQRWSEEQNSGYMLMSKMILACGLGDTLSKYRDENWETLYLTGQVQDLPVHPTEYVEGTCPNHRKYGFTIFAEPDEVWEATLGKSTKDITLQDIADYLEGTGHFDDAVNNTDYKNPSNILYRFVTYHILPEAISRDKLVVHWNEPGFNVQTSTQYTIPVMEYYKTMMTNRLIKIFQSKESNEAYPESGGIFLNRFPILRNGRGDFDEEHQNINDNHESGTFKNLSGKYMRLDENEGDEILNTVEGPASCQSVLNGYVYPIKNLLIYTENIQNQLATSRLRFDFASMYPEFMNNNLRALTTVYSEGTKQRGFPSNHQYFEGIDIADGTLFYYLPGRAARWHNYQGDELNIIGRYDFVMQLPPVPRDGHYEIRYGLSISAIRGMCQIYWGEDKKSLPATGIPMDLRLAGKYHYLDSGTVPSTVVGWEEDADDQATNDEVEKKMRANGFMKQINCTTVAFGSNVTLRTYEMCLRRIIVSAEMKADKTYYLRFKSVLDNEKKQCFMDFIEFCPKEVYDNPEEREDIW